MNGPSDALEHLLEAFRDLLEKHEERVLAEVDRRLEKMRGELSHARTDPRCLTVAEVLARYRFSRSKWDRLLADRSNGLCALLEPWRAGNRVLVPVAEFEAWWVGRRHRAGAGIAVRRA